VQTYYKLVNFNIPRIVFRRRRIRCSFGSLLPNVPNIPTFSPEPQCPAAACLF